MLSPRSRGKGSRRVPWRDGGRVKRKRPTWRKQATHSVDEVPEAWDEVVELTYRPQSRRSPAEAIYLLDQEVAGMAIRYTAELGGTRCWPVFTIRVPASCAAAVGAIIARIERR